MHSETVAKLQPPQQRRVVLVWANEIQLSHELQKCQPLLRLLKRKILLTIRRGGAAPNKVQQIASYPA